MRYVTHSPTISPTQHVTEVTSCPCISNGTHIFGIFDENGGIEFDQDVNATLPKTADSNEYIITLYQIMVPILLFACLSSFLANILIICSVPWIRRRRLSPNLTLSLSLAGADALASLVLGLGLVINSLLPVVFGFRLECHCVVLSLEALRLGSLVSTALHLLALAANHHVGISKPLHYVRIVTRRNTLVSAAVIWIAPIAFFFIYFSSVPNNGFQSPDCTNIEFLLYSPFRIATAVLFFIPLVAMTAIYGHIFAIVRKHQPQNNSSSDRRLKRNVKAAVTTLLILGAYVLGWMPAVLNFILTCQDCAYPFKTIPLDVRVPVGFFTNAMIVARCLVDPVLYLIRMPEINDALRDMFGLRTLVRNSSTPSSQNTRTDVRRLTLVTSQRKLNGCVNGRHVVTFDLKERML